MDSCLIRSKEQRKEFYEILENKMIYPVYQPIVSLADGSVLGYEALSRINRKNTQINISTLFKMAEELDKVWDLEYICRKQSLKNAKNRLNGAKLFLNVDPHVIHDEKFKTGLTYKYLERYNLKPDDIIFEITERSYVEDSETFRATIQHYKYQKFKIAIDDFGEGYAGVNRVCAVQPEYIKLDMAIVRNIDKDPMKQTMVENLVHLCKEIHIDMIAEGIETEEELKELIRLEVPYGQGYLLQMPDPVIHTLSEDCRRKICTYRVSQRSFSYKPSIFGCVGGICRAKNTTTTDVPAHFLYELIAKDISITEICVLDQESRVVGVSTRMELMEYFGGRFGYDLNSKKTMGDIMNGDFLMADANTSIEAVSKMALVRPEEHLYDAVVVTQEERYLGVVTVKDLLETAITIQVSRAVDTSPLTGLPGNMLIEKEIRTCIEEKQPFTIIYLDLDNFKAYNDAYGFHNGDEMIRTFVKSMETCCGKNEFMGHVGGDDFVIICSHWEAEELCQNIIDHFRASIRALYSENDWANGYIISKNRNGFTERFPMISVSIAGLTNRQRKFENLDVFSHEIAALKKLCKQKEGNYYSIL